MTKYDTKLIAIILIVTEEILQSRKSSLIILRFFAFPTKILRISFNERQIYLPRERISLKSISLISSSDPSQYKQFLDKWEVLLWFELTRSEIDHQWPSIGILRDHLHNLVVVASTITYQIFSKSSIQGNTVHSEVILAIPTLPLRLPHLDQLLKCLGEWEIKVVIEHIHICRN